MDSKQARIIELLREVHLIAFKEIERLNMRIAELETQHRQPVEKPIVKPTGIIPPTVNPATPNPPQPHPRVPEMMTEHDVAAFLKMSVASVRRWRLFRTGPKFLKVGSAVRYRRRDVESWVDTCAPKTSLKHA
jgi:predicted DNA-binding transcriptional regulator AlpA